MQNGFVLFPPPMETDTVTIRQECESAMQQAKEAITSESMADAEQARDKCNEAKSAAKTMIDTFDNEMDELRKQKRRLDDKLADLKREQRPWRAYCEDLELLARRCNNHFFSLRKEAQSFGQKV